MHEKIWTSTNSFCCRIPETRRDPSMPFIFSTTPLTQLDQSLPSGKPSLKKRIHEEKNRFAWLSNKIKIRFILTAKLLKMKLAVKYECLKIIYSVTKKDTFSRQERKSQDPWTWTLNEWLLWLQVSKVLWPFPKSHNTSRYYPFNRERLNSAALGLCCFPGKTKFAPGDCPGVLVIEWAGYATQLGVKCHRNSTQFWLVLRSLWSAVDSANW